MKKWSKVMIPSALAISTLLSTPAFAEPQSRPNGPWVENEQNISLSS